MERMGIKAAHVNTVQTGGSSNQYATVSIKAGGKSMTENFNATQKGYHNLTSKMTEIQEGKKVFQGEHVWQGRSFTYENSKVSIEKDYNQIEKVITSQPQADMYNRTFERAGLDNVKVKVGDSIMMRTDSMGNHVSTVAVQRGGSRKWENFSGSQVGQLEKIYHDRTDIMGGTNVDNVTGAMIKDLFGDEVAAGLAGSRAAFREGAGLAKDIEAFRPKGAMGQKNNPGSGSFEPKGPWSQYPPDFTKPVPPKPPWVNWD